MFVKKWISFFFCNFANVFEVYTNLYVEKEHKNRRLTKNTTNTTIKWVSASHNWSVVCILKVGELLHDYAYSTQLNNMA